MSSYDDISIMFDNLGYGYNAVINGLSIFILKTQVDWKIEGKYLILSLLSCKSIDILTSQEENLKGMVRSAIKDTVHSIIC